VAMVFDRYLRPGGVAGAPAGAPAEAPVRFSRIL
jgi:hypothetical protein